MTIDRVIVVLMSVVILLILIPVVRNLGIVERAYGWQQSFIGEYDNGDTIEYSLLHEYDFVLASWFCEGCAPVEVYTVLFKPSDLILGVCVRTRIQNNPVRLGCLNHNTQGSIFIGVINDQNQYQAQFQASVNFTGIKMISVF